MKKFTILALAAFFCLSVIVEAKAVPAATIELSAVHNMTPSPAKFAFSPALNVQQTTIVDGVPNTIYQREAIPFLSIPSTGGTMQVEGGGSIFNGMPFLERARVYKITLAGNPPCGVIPTAFFIRFYDNTDNYNRYAPNLRWVSSGSSQHNGRMEVSNPVPLVYADGIRFRTNYYEYSYEYYSSSCVQP